MSKDNTQKVNELKEEFERIQGNSNILDISKYLAKQDDLPDIGDIEIYNYDKDIEDSEIQARDLMESLVDLYLGDNPEIANHDYINKKMSEDSKIYADAIFLQKMTKKNMLTQLRQVDNGDNSARMHEVINQTIAQVRDNIKFAQTQRTDLEKFYKELRKDFGLNDMSESMEQKNTSKEEKSNETIMDNRSMNDRIASILREKKEKRD